MNIDEREDKSISSSLSESSGIATPRQWEGRIVQGIPGKHTSNPIVQRVLELGKEEFRSQFTLSQMSTMTKAQKRLKKIELGLQKLPETRLRLIKDDLLELQAIAQNAFDSEEMSKQDTGFLGIVGLIRQIAMETNWVDYATQQKDLQKTFLSFNKSINYLEEAIAIRPILIEKFEEEMKVKVNKFLGQLKERKISNMKLMQEREELLKLLDSSDGWGTMEETQGLLVLREKLEQSIIPSPGAHTRFQQARKGLEHYLLVGKTSANMRKLVSGYESTLAHSEDHFKTDKEAVMRLLEAQLEDIKTKITKRIVTSSYENKIKAAITMEPHLYPSEPFVNKKLKSFTKHLFVRYRLMRNMGITPTKIVFFEDENIKNVAKQVSEMTLSKNVVSISVPGHALLIITDPERRIFRYYSPYARRVKIA